MIQWLSVVVTVFMMMGFDNIPSHVLNQEKTRHQLFIACAKALKSVDEDSNYKDVDLTVCNDHQLLAKSMMADIKASSSQPSTMEDRSRDRFASSRSIAGSRGIRGIDRSRPG